MLEDKKRLTTEKIRAKFSNQFDLVNYAIKLAENMIHTGRDARVDMDVMNPATLILEEIETGMDHLDDVMEYAEEEVYVEKIQSPDETAEKAQIKKKPRKIMAS